VFDVTLDGPDDLGRAWRSVLSVLSDGIAQGVAQGIAEGTDEARTRHTYKDRTGGLTQSIGSELLTVTRGGAEGLIYARRPYASFVEEGTAPHVIRPKKGYRFKGPLRRGQSRRAVTDIGTHRVALRWYDDPATLTGVHFARVVYHPGSKPYPFMGRAYFRCERVMMREIERAIVAAQAQL
jgi:hypothetical protein